MKRSGVASACIFQIMLFLCAVLFLQTGACHAAMSSAQNGQTPQPGERKIFIEGEFLLPGEYTFSEGERLRSVIERAGGLTSEAYPYGAVFMRESIREVQEQRINEYAERLEQDILASTAEIAETAMDEDRAETLRKDLAARKQILEQLRTACPTGRTVIDLEEVLALPSSAFNVELMPGDRLFVPKRPGYVKVIGGVRQPKAFFFEKDKDVDYYLDQVEGLAREADRDRIYVVRANGSVVSLSQDGNFGMLRWDTAKKRWAMGGFDSMIVAPGDTIIVHKSTPRSPLPGIVRSAAEIMYQIAVAVCMLAAAF